MSLLWAVVAIVFCYFDQSAHEPMIIHQHFIWVAWVYETWLSACNEKLKNICWRRWGDRIPITMLMFLSKCNSPFSKPRFLSRRVSRFVWNQNSCHWNVWWWVFYHNSAFRIIYVLQTVICIMASKSKEASLLNFRSTLSQSTFGFAINGPETSYSETGIASLPKVIIIITIIIIIIILL